MSGGTGLVGQVRISVSHPSAIRVLFLCPPPARLHDRRPAQLRETLEGESELKKRGALCSAVFLDAVLTLLQIDNVELYSGIQVGDIQVWLLAGTRALSFAQGNIHPLGAF